VELWTLYNRPTDRRCAVRKVLVEDEGLQATDEQLFRNVQEARSVLARRGLVRVPRADDDEPTMIETWL
jgi:hypothetical protein